MQGACSMDVKADSWEDTLYFKNPIRVQAGWSKLTGNYIGSRKVQNR